MSRSGNAQQRWLKQLSRNGSSWIRLSIALGLVSGLLLILQAHILASVIHDTLFADGSLMDQWGLWHCSWVPCC